MEGRSAQEALREYISTSTSTHQDRMDFLQQANSIIATEYTQVEADIVSFKEDQGHLNHEIDALINSFSVVDTIEEDITKTEANIDLIFKTINRIGKRISELKKAKGKK